MTKIMPSQLQELIGQHREITYQKGEILLRPYDELHSLFVIKSGYVQSHAISEDGSEFALNIFRAGAVVPLSLALVGAENIYTFEAISLVKAIKVPTHELVTFLSQNPDTTLTYLKNFASALNRLSMRMESIVFGTAAQKVAAALVQTHLRFGDKLQREKQLAFVLTHRQIAAMTGLTRETVSAEMIKLKRDDIIYYESGKVSILDLEKLKQNSSISHYFAD